MHFYLPPEIWWIRCLSFTFYSWNFLDSSGLDRLCLYKGQRFSSDLKVWVWESYTKSSLCPEVLDRFGYTKYSFTNHVFATEVVMFSSITTIWDWSQVVPITTYFRDGYGRKETRRVFKIDVRGMDSCLYYELILNNHVFDICVKDEGCECGDTTLMWSMNVHTCSNRRIGHVGIILS